MKTTISIGHCAIRLGLLVYTALPAMAGTYTVGETNQPSLLPQEILSAHNAGYSNVTVNPGTYVMPNGSSAAFSFSGWKNFTLNASNVLFVVGSGDCFDLNSCTNMTIQGATVRPKTFPFTQGRVVGIGTNSGTLYCDWQIAAGYPTTNFDWWFNAVYASNKVINLPVGDIYYSNHYGTDSSGVASNAVYLGSQTWRLNFPGWLSSFKFQTNDWLVARAGSQGFAFYLNGCSNCTLLNVTSQSGGFATYRENLGGGNHMLGCQIQPAPVPPTGGTELPVVACGADGVHTTWTYPGLDLENCVFQGVLLDDNIAIHGNYENVVSNSSNTVTFDGAGKFAVGDPVRISDPNGTYFAQANCTAIQKIGSTNYMLTLDQSLTIPAGAVGSNPKYNGSGYKVINCQLGNVRSRAIYCKADNGLIAGNTIQDADSAIKVGPGPTLIWSESDFAWNVTISNNTILHCGSYGINLETTGPTGNRNITIQDNCLQDVFLGDAINLRGCDGVTLAGNLVVNPVAGHHIIWLTKCTNIVLLKNLVTNNPAGVSLVEMASSVTNVQNQTNGIILAGGPYLLANASSNLVVNLPAGGGVASQVVQQASGGGDNEHWTICPVGSGYCALLCVANGLALGVNGSVASNAPVVMETYAGAGSQLWALAPISDKYVALTNKLSGMAVHSQSSANGQGLVQRPFAGSTNQEWLLLSPAAPVGLNAVPGTGVQLTWNAYSGASSYTVLRATSASGPYVTLAAGLAATNYTDTSALAAGTYYYVVAASLGAILTPYSSPASVVVTAAYYWDSDGNSANGVTDGGGTWDGTSMTWLSSTSLADTNWPGGYSTAVFGNTAGGTVTISGTQNIAGLTFNTPYALDGGTLSSSIYLPMAVSNRANATISSLLTGSATGLLKTGAGTLSLSGANTFGGTTTVSGGTLLVNGDSSSATNTVTVAAGATLGGSGRIGGSVTLASGALATNVAGSPLAILGALTLNNNTLYASTSSALGAGNYTVMTYNATGSSGSFNPAPVISGAGLAATMAATLVTGSGAVTLHIQASTNIVASDNAWTYRNAPSTVQDASQELQVKMNTGSSMRIGYARFNLSSFLSSHDKSTITSATLRLYLAATGTSATFDVYGILDNANGINGGDASWSPGTMTWNNQIAGNVTSLLPTTNTTAMPLGSAFIAATAVGEFDVVLTNAEFLSFLDADSNQQITLAFYDEATANSQWHIASIGNTAGYLKPTLALQVTPAPGNPRITSVELVGSNLRLVGTNVPASSGRPYWVIMSNNVTRTLSGWGHVTNGAFAANGRFTNTMPVSGALQFFIIEVP